MILLFWTIIILWGTQRPRRVVYLRRVMACGLAFSMGMQLLLLKVDGLLCLETGLPLHLCGLFGVLSIPMLWRAPTALTEASAYLAAPAAFFTLFFPAVISCTHPGWMRFAFYQLHALVALMPLFLFRTGKPMPQHPHKTLLLGIGYLLVVDAFNRVLSTNYLFLRAAPAGTPLAAFLARGKAFYICSLLMLCMVVFSWLNRLYGYFRK